MTIPIQTGLQLPRMPEPLPAPAVPGDAVGFAVRPDAIEGPSGASFSFDFGRRFERFEAMRDRLPEIERRQRVELQGLESGSTEWSAVRLQHQQELLAMQGELHAAVFEAELGFKMLEHFTSSTKTALQTQT